MRENTGMNKKKKEVVFTMVELLVVISIMVILLSLLLPALGKAKESGRRILCVNNLKECVVSATSYMSDFNGRMTAYCVPSTGDMTWATLFYDAKHISNFSCVVCPAYWPYKYDKSTGISKYYIYGMLYFFNYQTQFFQGKGGAGTLLSGGMQFPSDYPLLSDSSTSDGKQWFNFDFVITSAGMHLRHGGRANIVFLDGHAESCDPTRIASFARRITSLFNPTMRIKVYDAALLEKQIGP